MLRTVDSVSCVLAGILLMLSGNQAREGFFPLTLIGWWEEHHRLVNRMFTQTKAGMPSCSQKLVWYDMGFKLPGKRFFGTFKLLNLKNSSFKMNAAAAAKSPQSPFLPLTKLVFIPL